MQPPSGTSETAITRQSPPAAVGDATPLPPAPTLVSASGDTCTTCGATVAADQRYCIECGERRGDPRLPFMDGSSAMQATAAPVPVSPYGAYPPAAPPKSKWSSGLAMLATLGLLLLAMGVGVLIGNDGKDANATAQQPVIIGGAGATTATGASDATAASGNKSKAAASTADADGNTSSGVDANALAKKNGVKLAAPTVKLGDKCEKGAVGCDDNGKFSGDYFK